MKKRHDRSLIFLLCLSLLLTLLPLTTAHAAVCGYLTYTVSNGAVTITNCDTSASGELAIPGTIDGYPVNHIGDRAFYDCKNLTNITIPNSVTGIGDYAFHNCDSLINITIPNSVTSIGAYALYHCDNLTNITIPASVTSIGDHAFYFCANLTNITIPASVTSIGDHAFYFCANLTSIQVNENNSVYSSDSHGVLFDKAQSILIAAPKKLSGSYQVPDSVTSIEQDAFRGCDSLTGITIPDSVTRIGEWAFANCSSLTYTVQGNCKYLGNESNPYYALIDTTSSTITSAAIHSSTKLIGDGAFYFCGSLTDITIPDGVTRISKGAFQYCDDLASITIPDSVTGIGDQAFLNCTSLTGIAIPDSVTSIGDYAFYSCSSLSSITIPDSVTSIGRATFSDCSHLTSITIPDGVTDIGEQAFLQCTSLTGIAIPDSVTSIGDTAFSGCSRLTSITIPDSVTSIGARAFHYCDSLIHITIPDSVTSIGDSAFYHCRSLTGIWVNEHNPLYSSDSHGVLFNKEQSILVAAPGNISISYQIPDSVTGIEGWAFASCTSLTGVTIPDSVTRIGDYAFYWCTGLSSITLPDSVTSIGRSAFDECTNLTFNVHDECEYLGNENNPYHALIGTVSWTTATVTVHANTKVIVGGAFDYSTSLTSITIADQVTSIGDSAFYDCDNLAVIHFNGSAPTFEGSLDGCYTHKVCYPAGDASWTEAVKASAGSNLTWVEIQVTECTSNQDATCTQDGTKTGICQTCGTVVTVTDPGSATGHRYQNGVCMDCGIENPDFVGTSLSYSLKTHTAGKTTLVLTPMDGTMQAITMELEDGSHQVIDLSPIEYNIFLSKEGHGARTYQITLQAGQNELDLTLNLSGDINGDGSINIIDVAKIYAHAQGGSQLEDYALSCGDLTGDGIVNIIDTARAYARVTNT